MNQPQKTLPDLLQNISPRRIFISIPWFTPAYKAGGPIQSILNLVNREIAGVEYFVFTSNRDLDQSRLEGIEANNWYQFNDQTKVFYSKRVGRADVLMAQVKLVQPDILYSVGVFDWHFNIIALFFCRAPKKILSARGMLHTAALKQKAFKKNLFLSFVKMMGIRQFVQFHATDEIEKGFILEVFGKNARVHIAQNYPRLFDIGERSVKHTSLQLLSICLISKMKNILLVIESLQYCEQQIDYNIYGVIKDADYWQQCQEAIKTLPQNIRVIYHKDLIPSSVEQVLAAHQVFIQPSESENFGHALVEAFSAGLPVITSNFTGWNNLQQERAGINVELNETSVANAITFFAHMKQAEYMQWRTAAANYIRERINTSDIDLQHHQIFFGND